MARFCGLCRQPLEKGQSMHWQSAEKVSLEEPSLCLSTVLEWMLIPCVVDQEDLGKKEYSFPVSTDDGAVWAWA